MARIELLAELLKPFASLERLLRHIVPGVTFIALCVLAFGPSLSVPEPRALVLFMVPFAGTAMYAFHRTVFELVDWLILAAMQRWWPLPRGLSPRANSIPYIAALNAESLRRCSADKEFRDWNYGKWANLHLSAMVTEQALIFGMISLHQQGSWLSLHLPWLPFAGIAGLVLTLFSYVVTHAIHREQLALSETIAKSTTESDSNEDTANQIA